jgi:hypothetical protein
MVTSRKENKYQQQIYFGYRRLKEYATVINNKKTANEGGQRRAQ